MACHVFIWLRAYEGARLFTFDSREHRTTALAALDNPAAGAVEFEDASGLAQLTSLGLARLYTALTQEKMPEYRLKADGAQRLWDEVERVARHAPRISTCALPERPYDVGGSVVWRKRRATQSENSDVDTGSSAKRAGTAKAKRQHRSPRRTGSTATRVRKTVRR